MGQLSQGLDSRLRAYEASLLSIIPLIAQRVQLFRKQSMCQIVNGPAAHCVCNSRLGKLPCSVP